jgi:hypothetical protein
MFLSEKRSLDQIFRKLHTRLQPLLQVLAWLSRFRQSNEFCYVSVYVNIRVLWFQTTSVVEDSMEWSGNNYEIARVLTRWVIWPFRRLRTFKIEEGRIGL